MEGKLFYIILLLLEFNANGLRLQNVTSKNLTKRSINQKFGNSFNQRPQNRPPPLPRALPGNSNYVTYARYIYNDIASKLHWTEQGSQFAFLLIVHTWDTRFELKNGLVRNMMNNPDQSVPRLKTGEVYPRSAQSNLVIAGVDERKPSGKGDYPYHSEQHLIPSLVIMDNYCDTQFGLICPELIILGSTYDTCFSPGNFFTLM